MFTEKWLDEKLKAGQHRIISELPHLMPEIAKPKRNGKYNATKKEVDGFLFHSTGEALRYVELRRQTELGLIQHEKKWLQVPFVIQGKAVDDEGQKIREVRYVADFVYFVGNVTVVEDYKGYITDEFKSKYNKFVKRYPHFFLWPNNDVEALFVPELMGFYTEQYKKRCEKK